MAYHRTPEQEQETRDRLLKVCMLSFLKQGYAKATMKTLADAAGCTTGKFYGNFTGKPELLRLLMGRVIRMTQVEVDNILGEDASPLLRMAFCNAALGEAAHINAKIAELYYYALVDWDIQNDISERYIELIGDVLRDKYGYQEDEETRLMRGLSAAGALQTVLAKEHKNPTDEPRLRLMIELQLRAYGVPTKDIEEILQRIAEEDENIHEVAYASIVHILQANI